MHRNTHRLLINYRINDAITFGGYCYLPAFDGNFFFFLVCLDIYMHTNHSPDAFYTSFFFSLRK